MAVDVHQVEGVVIVAGDDGVGIGGRADAEFIENGIVFEDLAEFGFQGVLDCNGGDWFFGVGDVPYFNCQIVAGNDELAVLLELGR